MIKWLIGIVTVQYSAHIIIGFLYLCFQNAKRIIVLDICEISEWFIGMMTDLQSKTGTVSSTHGDFISILPCRNLANIPQGSRSHKYRQAREGWRFPPVSHAPGRVTRNGQSGCPLAVT